MKPRFSVVVLTGLALAAAAAAPSYAHHSAAMFDGAHPMDLDGTVKQFNWTNPHISVDFYADGQAGQPAKLWTLEASSTGVMTRAGWTKRTLNPGDRVKILFKPLRDGGPAGSITTVTLASGKTLSWSLDAVNAAAQ